MGFLSNLLHQKTKDDFSSIKKEVDKDIRQLRIFLKIYEIKINNVKKLIPYWQEGKTSEIEEAEKIVKALPQLNKELQSLITKLLKTGKLRRLIASLVNTEIEEAKAQGRNLPASKEHIGKLKIYFQQIADNLKFLKKILLSQSLYLSKKSLGPIVKDLEEHRSFYLLLKSESELDARIKQNMLFIMRETQEFIQVQSIRTKFVSSLKFEDMVNPSGINFKNFHRLIYLPNFPDPNERDPKQWMQTYLHLTYQRNHMKKNQSHTHLVLAKVKEELMGGR